MQFARRGFETTTTEKRRLLEHAGMAFVVGYNAALDAEPDAMAQRLGRIDRDLQGFAYEGAAMGYAMLEASRLVAADRCQTFLAGLASPHIYMAHVGIGWTFARLPWSRKSFWARLHPLLRWLALDGFGFHLGYFQPDRYLRRSQQEPIRPDYAVRVLDQGLGRALWFAAGAQPGHCTRILDAKARARRGDFWSGIGLAAAYAGGAGAADWRSLRDLSATHRSHFAQGIAFAAKARVRAGNVTDYTEQACQTIWAGSAAQVAAVTDRALPAEPKPDSGEGYESWRSAIRQAFLDGRSSYDVA